MGTVKTNAYGFEVLSSLLGSDLWTYWYLDKTR